MAAKQGFLHLNISKTKILATLGVVAVLLLPLMPLSASADQYQAQIDALKTQISQNQTAANQKAGEADTLRNKLAIINDQINAAQSALNLTSSQIAQTNAQIDTENKELDRQKVILKENLRIVYKQGETSPIELIASSKNLSDFVAQQQYLSAIKQKIDSNLVKIAQIKADLSIKKDSLTSLSSNQQGQVNAIASQRAQQSNLLAQTQGDEARYQAIIGESKKQLSATQAAQAAAISASSSGSVYGGTGGYPWANAPWPNMMADHWNFFQRQCTSYAVWKFSALHPNHQIPTWWGSIVPTNAKHFPDRARSTPGFGVYSSPQVGDIAIYTGGTYGHAMIVKSISGSKVRVTQYNANWEGQFSESDWDISSLVFIR